MKYEMSPNIAIYVKDLVLAKEFYVEILGFKEVESPERWIELKSGPNRLFLMESNKEEGAVHELFVTDLDQAKLELLKIGCKVIRWEGKGKDCYVQDPFGVLFNIWEP